MYYLTMQPIDDVAYDPSNLVEFTMLCRPPVLTFFEQYPYLVQCSVYNPSYIDNIDYVLILSVSCSPSCCIREGFCNIYRKPVYIQCCYLCQTSTSSVITIRTMSIIVYLSSTLQRLLGAVRTSIYNNTSCILSIVSVVL